jgi:polyisoprenoid-binding protein YceI
MIRLTALVLALMLVSCATRDSGPKAAPAALPDFPLESYVNAAAGSSVYQVDADSSSADIVVRRGGKLAHFGHDHVVSARNMFGYLSVAGANPDGSRADLRLDLMSLTVDDPLARKKFKLDTNPGRADIQNTSQNMQGKVLESDKWPQIHLSLVVTGGTLDALEADLTVTLHGQQVTFPITIDIEELTPDQLIAFGSFDLLQSAFGIEPFSALAGGLYVEDTIEVHYRLVAKR